MTRPIRLQYPGALYHVTTRGDRKRGIYNDDNDRLVWNHLLGNTCSRFNMIIHAYCQMGNHYHLLAETVEPNLADCIRYLNGCYSAYFNRKYRLVGHVFQGRYKAIICQAETYLLELVRYIVLNPVRARMVKEPEHWWWSSHRAMLGLGESPAWLDATSLLKRFGEQPDQAKMAYRQFVLAGIGRTSPLAAVRHQTVLGDDAFIARLARSSESRDPDIARVQRRTSASDLDYYFNRYDRKEAMARAYYSTHFSMNEIAKHTGVSTRTVSRAVRKFEVTNGPDRLTILES